LAVSNDAVGKEWVSYAIEGSIASNAKSALHEQSGKPFFLRKIHSEKVSVKD
jgi:hypothetical protein